MHTFSRNVALRGKFTTKTKHSSVERKRNSCIKSLCLIPFIVSIKAENLLHIDSLFIEIGQAVNDEGIIE